MTYFYYKTSTLQDGGVTDETRKFWEHAYNKDDKWIDTTRRETMEGAEAAIDASIEHYKKKLAFANGPVVVKTFK